MFWPSVVDLKQFYSSALGQVVRSAIERRILDWWPQAKDETLIGIGYTTPYLRGFSGKTMLNVALMPAQQGAIYWPASGTNLTALVHEGDLPLADNLANRVLLVHSLENTEALRFMLMEIWRVLTPGGRVLVVVPNRKSAWARSAKSPFANGQPYSTAQLKKLLSEYHFTPTRQATALFMFPNDVGFLHRCANALEAVGNRLFPAFGGVVLMEAEKQIYAATKDALAVHKGRRIYAPVPKPVMTRSNTDSLLNRYQSYCRKQ